MVPARSQVELEALKGSKHLLKQYNAVNDTWLIRFEGPFWKAIEHAHHLGYRGAGSSVAVIDTACDMNIPRLRCMVREVRDHFVPHMSNSPPFEHGTAVALLIGKVAPECHLDIYPVVQDNGEVDVYAVRDAILEAAKSDVNVINLSLGDGHSVTLPTDVAFDTLISYIDKPRQFIERYAAHSSNCVLCTAAKQAAQNGKLVFAAAGNNTNQVFCPARADGVFAVGFQKEKRRVIKMKAGESLEVTYGDRPEASQAVIWDLVLQEVSGVVGTSFASPLFAGVGALGITAHEMSAYVASDRTGFLAMFLHALLREGKVPNDKIRSVVKRTMSLYRESWQRLPHWHSLLPWEPNQRVTIAPISSCFACGFFAHPLFTNMGLFFLETGNLSEALILLKLARDIAPWSADAAANLGRLLEEMGNLQEALKQYDEALKLRPGFIPYIQERAEIYRRLRQ